MKSVYNILNNQDKVTMQHFYHIICNPDLDEGFYAMQSIPCTCTRQFEQLSNTWLPDLDKMHYAQRWSSVSDDGWYV